MPKLWRETIGAHQEEVRGAILDATERLAHEQGPLSLTMSQIAAAAGIGRATLYKYFADVEAIIQAWHERHVHGHVERMSRIADGPGDAITLLDAVLTEYATALTHSHQGDLGAVLHRHAGMADAQRHLTDLLDRLITDAVPDGSVRSDVPARELATWCIHALAAARHLRRKDATQRLVAVTVDGLAGHAAARWSDPTSSRALRRT